MSNAGGGLSAGLSKESPQAAHLRLDVDAGFAATNLTFVPRLNELPDLGLSFDLRQRAPGSWRRPRRRLVDRKVATAELVEETERAGEQDRRDRSYHEHHDPDHSAETHVSECRRRRLVRPCGRRL